MPINALNLHGDCLCFGGMPATHALPLSNPRSIGFIWQKRSVISFSVFFKNLRTMAWAECCSGLGEVFFEMNVKTNQKRYSF